MNSYKQLLELKAYILGEINKGNFTLHPQDILNKLNEVIDAVDSERKS